MDKIESEVLLQTLFDFLDLRQNALPGGLWHSMNTDQRQEVMDAFEESEVDENLIERINVFKK